MTVSCSFSIIFEEHRILSLYNSTRSGLIKEYPMESQPPVCPQERVSVSDQPTPINNIVFSGECVLA